MRFATRLPLHPGHAPRWLFPRMVRLSKAIGNVIIDEYGADDFLERLCNKEWFQALACAIGYDWHSSGTTTVTVGALKEAFKDSSEIFIAGGKGKAGTNTPNDIVRGVDKLSIPGNEKRFTDISRLSAKVDVALVYDKIGIYQHSFLFTKNKKWGVIQQAMDNSNDMAIRFQWFSDYVNSKDLTTEPHSAVESALKKNSLDLTFQDNAWAKDSSVELVASLDELRSAKNDVKQTVLATSYPARHEILPTLDVSKRGWEALENASELEPKDYQELLLVKGIGRSTLRSLAIVSSLIYGKELAYRDPVAYSYNLGGKDGIPFPVNRKTYDSVSEEMENIIDSARIEGNEKYHVLRRLNAAVERQRNLQTPSL